MANKKALVWIGIASALVIGGGIFWWVKSRNNDKDKKDEDVKDVNLDESTTTPPVVTQPYTSPAPPQQPETLPPSPFKNKAEGNAFRGWMAKNHNDFRYMGEPLDTSGSYDNIYIRKAWQLYGGEYTKAATPTAPTPPASKEIKSGDMIYLKGNGAILYTYPEAKFDYNFGRVMKSYVLDKKIGSFVSDAPNGFAKINVVWYQPLNKQNGTYGNYVANVKTVYTQKYNLSKTPY